MKTSHKGSVEGAPRRPESSGEQLLPTRAKPPGTTRETASRWGKAAVAPASGHFGLVSEVQERSGERKRSPHHREEKSSEGRSPSALGTETDPQGERQRTPLKG